jgi:hypothetical protein
LKKENKVVIKGWNTLLHMYLGDLKDIGGIGGTPAWKIRIPLGQWKWQAKNEPVRPRKIEPLVTPAFFPFSPSQAE